MEIHTSNLLEVSVQQSRLQNNFQTIATALKDLLQQISTLAHNHQQTTSFIAQNEQQVRTLRKRTDQNSALLHQHHNWMQQLNAQFGVFQTTQSPLEQQKPIREAASIEVPSFRFSEAGGNNNQNHNPTLKQPRKSSQKNGGLPQMLSSIKQRLKTLQRDSQQKDAQIQQLNRLFTKKGQHKQKRVSIVSKELSKNKLSKRELKQSNIMLQFKENLADEKSEAHLSHHDKMSPTQEKSEEDLANGKMEGVLVSLSRDFEKMKEAMAQKNRILDSHFKENHQKMQSLERNMDILERSHDMLKYDFERTSTSFSKPTPQGQRRHEDRLNDTRVSNKEYYQDKLVELFNDMEFLKNQYFQLQAKLEKEVENEPEEDKNERKARIGQKLLNGQRVSEESLRGEVVLQRQQLKRLRQQFQSFAFGVNTGSNEVKTILIKPNENKQDWKSLSTKMQKLKMELHSAIRQLEGKIVTSNEMIVEFNQIEVAVEECKLLLKRKVEHSDFDKSTKRIEAKLNHFIMQIYEKQGQESEFQAALAKQPWFCLSCDSELKNYTGKVQKSSVNAQKLAGRKVNTQCHMVRRNENGRLPSVVK